MTADIYEQQYRNAKFLYFACNMLADVEIHGRCKHTG